MVKVQREIFNCNDILDQMRVKNHNIGAIVSFLGLVRDFNSINKNESRLFIEQYDGMTLKELTAPYVAKLLTRDLHPNARRILEIRIETSKTSTSKYTRVVNGVNRDGRLRGLIQFNGAYRTGRQAGRLFQPQSLPRGSVPQDELEEFIERIRNREDIC